VYQSKLESGLNSGLGVGHEERKSFGADNRRCCRAKHQCGTIQRAAHRADVRCQHRDDDHERSCPGCLEEEIVSLLVSSLLVLLSYGYYRPNPSPLGGWNTQRGGVSLPSPSLMASDSRLKEAMVPLKQFDNGIELYLFRYKRDSETYVGVIAQQVARLVPDAVVRGEDGYLRVDYGRLGLRLMTWTEWKLSRAYSN